ncbi:MAG TPA: LysR substrate-binding domain-containing protein [Stellaceae bacterium]|nr:LysR substrate-binding domain-containing protein [Stellaceae bacterium]
MARGQLPPLNGLRAFEAAARLGSFAAAGDELGVTPGAVSQQVRALEARLGVSLFERRPQSLAPTAAGQALLPALTEALDAIAAAVGGLRGEGERATPLRIACPAGFAAGFLLPRLDRFHQRVPAVALTLTATERLVEPGGNEVDCAIRFGRAGWRGELACDFLFVDCRLPVCSPRYAQSRPIAAEAADPLAGHTLLEALSQPEDWPDWLSWAGIAGERRQRLSFGDERLATEAACRGLGLALADRALVADLLAAGTLVAPLASSEMRRGTAWFLVYPAGSRDGAVGEFRAWLLDECGGRER